MHCLTARPLALTLVKGTLVIVLVINKNTGTLPSLSW